MPTRDVARARDGLSSDATRSRRTMVVACVVSRAAWSVRRDECRGGARNQIALSAPRRIQKNAADEMMRERTDTRAARQPVHTSLTTVEARPTRAPRGGRVRARHVASRARRRGGAPARSPRDAPRRDGRGVHVRGDGLARSSRARGVDDDDVVVVVVVGRRRRPRRRRRRRGRGRVGDRRRPGAPRAGRRGHEAVLRVRRSLLPLARRRASRARPPSWAPRVSIDRTVLRPSPLRPSRPVPPSRDTTAPRDSTERA
jgi:hypothetical protein